MGDWNKMGPHANKFDWTWKAIQETAHQQANAISFKKALADAQIDETIRKNLVTYVRSISFVKSILILLLFSLVLDAMVCTTLSLFNGYLSNLTFCMVIPTLR